MLLREWSVTLLRLSILKHVVIAAAQQRQDQDRPPGGRAVRAVPAAAAGRPGSRWDDASATVLFYVAQVLLAGAVAMTLWSGYEFFRDVWRQRGNIRQSAVR